MIEQGGTGGESYEREGDRIELRRRMDALRRLRKQRTDDRKTALHDAIMDLSKSLEYPALVRSQDE